MLIFKIDSNIGSNNPVRFESITPHELYGGSCHERRKKGEIPILHFECHGSKENGIYLPSIKKHIDWKILNKLFANVNKRPGTILCLQSPDAKVQA
jgi:hypothetical protein